MWHKPVSINAMMSRAAAFSTDCSRFCR